MEKNNTNTDHDYSHQERMDLVRDILSLRANLLKESTKAITRASRLFDILREDSNEGMYEQAKMVRDNAILWYKENAQPIMDYRNYDDMHYHWSELVLSHAAIAHPDLVLALR